MTPTEFYRVIRLPHTKDKLAKWQLMTHLCYTSVDANWPEFPMEMEPKMSMPETKLDDMRISIDLKMEKGSVAAGKERCHIGSMITLDDMINAECNDENKFCDLVLDKLKDMQETMIRGVHDNIVEHKNACSS